MEIEAIKLAVYLPSGEVASSLSERRFELSPAQAREYLITDYIGRHRGATRPPAPIAVLAPPDPGAAGLSRLERLVVAVTAEGDVTDVRLADPDSTAEVEAYAALVRPRLFYPALAGGRPVAGEFRGSLSELW